MKVVEYHWETPFLRAYQRQFKAGEHLFRQGQSGQTVFIVIRGIVQLTAERDGVELIISTLEAGHVLGERALITTKAHKRFFGAVAKTDVAAAELSLKDMEQIEQFEPKLVNDIFRRICQLSIERVDRLDHLVKVLRPMDNLERLVYLIIHFAHFEGRPTPEGIQVPLSVDTLRYYLPITQFEIDECLKILSRSGVLKNEGKDHYILKDQNALIQSLPTLKDKLPNLQTI